MLWILDTPRQFAHGPVPDVLGPKTEAGLWAAGVPCTIRPLWSNFWSRYLWNSRIPFRRRAFHHVIAPYSCRRHLRAIGRGDVVWINGFSLPLCDRCAVFERAIRRQGAYYLFQLLDDWTIVSDAFREATLLRAGLANMVVVPTPQLAARIAEVAPQARVEVLQEPVDVDRLKPCPAPSPNKLPRVFWTGRPNNLRELSGLDRALREACDEVPFVLRLVGGKSRPSPSLSVPWEWMPYDAGRESETVAGSLVALAPIGDTPFNRCKGNYKVKTYMAMGLPVLASPVGYNLDLIRHGETGFFAGFPGEWTATLVSLLRDPARAAQVGRRAREFVVNRFSHSALMPDWAARLRAAFPKLTAGAE